MKRKGEIAAAIKYDGDLDSAPKVIAKGHDFTAQRIKEIAEEMNIPIYQDEALAKQLVNLSIGQEIPPALYQVVAEILAFVIQLDEQRGKEYATKQNSNRD